MTVYATIPQLPRIRPPHAPHSCCARLLALEGVLHSRVPERQVAHIARVSSGAQGRQRRPDKLLALLLSGGHATPKLAGLRRAAVLAVHPQAGGLSAASPSRALHGGNRRHDLTQVRRPGPAVPGTALLLEDLAPVPRQSGQSPGLGCVRPAAAQPGADWRVFRAVAVVVLIPVACVAWPSRVTGSQESAQAAWFLGLERCHCQRRSTPRTVHQLCRLRLRQGDLLLHHLGQGLQHLWCTAGRAALRGKSAA